MLREVFCKRFNFAARDILIWIHSRQGSTVMTSYGVTRKRRKKGGTHIGKMFR